MGYTFDNENGIIKDTITGDRCVIITKARLEQIFQRFTDIFQSGADVIIAEGMRASGERFATEVPEETKVDLTVFLKTAVQRFTEAGLGKIEIVDFKAETAELKFRIWNNLFAEMHKGAGTYCDAVANFVSGIYRQLTSETPKIEKTKCIGKNDPYCEWHLSPE
jgi:predicted hydrocarbon binding protein